MEFGIALPTPADSWKTVKRAEDAGFSTAWFYDTQLVSADIFVAMGAATLNALAPGRIDAGFGTGFTSRLSMGLGPHKLSDMDEYIRVIMALLRGEKPELRIEGKTRKVGFLNPETKLINIEEPVPVYVSALGSKSRRMTAELDAHWINVNFSEEFSAITARNMEAEYRGSGRDPAGKRKTIFSFGSVLKEGEGYDSPRVKAESGPIAMMMLHNAMEQNYGSLIGEFESSMPP